MDEIRYLAGLYLRLSKEDIRDSESASIENQRLILSKYAQEHTWDITDTYIDDGWSGTDFRRPAFQRMLQDARDGRINLIIVKDLSRLGRNHIEINRLTEEVFPKLGVRFIALADCVDSLQGENDIAIYRNLFNEMQSKDISRKVRAVKRARMERGLYLGTYAPIGYRKDPADKYRFLIDEETAPIVRRIFDMRVCGHGYSYISTALNREHIPSPRALYYSRTGKRDPLGGSGLWNELTVKAILQNEVYIGHMIQGKYGTISFKDHRLVDKPREQWVRVENTHDPLINMETWEQVQFLMVRNYRPRNMSDGVKNMFSGILICGDCGSNMRASVKRSKRKDGSEYHHVGYICENYSRNGKKACTAHFVSEDGVLKPVLEELQRYAKITPIDVQSIIARIQRAMAQGALEYLSTFQRELKSAEMRLEQIDAAVQSLYEDKLCGIVSDSIFKMLISRYEREHGSKISIISALRSTITRSAQKADEINSWKNTIHRYAKIDTLTSDILLALVDHIKVFEPEKVDSRRHCNIHVVYRFA